MKEFNLAASGWERTQLEKETVRVFDVCDGCRRCFNLCPSFNMLFDRIDAYESDTTKLTASDFEHVEKTCYYCKLCYNHCPYTPPHQYEIDFPRLMIGWKKQRVVEQGATWRDTLLVQTDFIGKLGSLTAPVVNRLLRTRWARTLLERVMGIHRDRWILPFDRTPFLQWWKRRSSAIARQVSSSPTGRVVLFPSCLVSYQATDIGKAAVQVLEKNRVEVVVPEGIRCCGMPRFDVGDTEKIVAAARANVKAVLPYLEKGYDLVVPIPSCSLTFKREYPYLCPGDPAMATLAERTFDVCEYLMRLKRNGRLALDFQKNPGHVVYQIPCHLRDQNIGFKSKELLELTGATVHLIEKCSGHDGTWSAKVEFFDLSMQMANKVLRDIDDELIQFLASDCPLSALQLEQARARCHASSVSVLHPIQIVRDAYALAAE